MAQSEARIVLTMDLDFGQIMALTRRSAPSTILFRMRNQTPLAVKPRLLRVLRECQLPLESGAFVPVEDNGYRIRSLPLVKFSGYHRGFKERRSDSTCVAPQITCLRRIIVFRTEHGQRRAFSVAGMFE